MAKIEDQATYLLDSVIDAATISVSSGTNGLSGDKIVDNLVRKVYRSRGKNNEWVKFDVGSATSFNEVNIFNHTFTRTAVVKFQAHASDSWSSPSVDHRLDVATDSLGSTIVPKLSHYFQTLHTYQWVRLYIEDSSNASSTVDIGRIMVGRQVIPDRNMRDGFQLRTIDPSRGLQTAGRQAYFNIKKAYTEISYGITDMDEAQHDELIAIYNKVGMHKAFALSIDPLSRPHQNSFYVQFSADITRRHRVIRQFGLEDVTFSEKN